jgi:hypothetical protein
MQFRKSLAAFMKNNNVSKVLNKNYQFYQPITGNLKVVNSPGSVDKPG